jgi:hypothetical protein
VTRFVLKFCSHSLSSQSVPLSSHPVHCGMSLRQSVTRNKTRVAVLRVPSPPTLLLDVPVPVRAPSPVVVEDMKLSDDSADVVGWAEVGGEQRQLVDTLRVVSALVHSSTRSRRCYRGGGLNVYPAVDGGRRRGGWSRGGGWRRSLSRGWMRGAETDGELRTTR